MLAGVLPGRGRNLGCEQHHDQPVFIRGPCGAVMAKKARPRAFFTAKTERAINEPLHKPFEADWHLGEAASKLADYTIDHAAADQRFSYDDVLAPSRTM